jgi:DNA-binding CsgD family transcriptional regulator
MTATTSSLESTRIFRAAHGVVDRAREDLAGSAYRVDVVARARDAVKRGAGRVASVLLIDPCNGRTAGVVSIIGPADAADDLMLSYAKSIARQIEDRLVADTGAAEQTMTEHFARARRRMRGAIVAISETMLLYSAGAARFVNDRDRTALWARALRMLDGTEHIGTEVELEHGSYAVVMCEPVVAEGVRVGALLRLEEPTRHGRSKKHDTGLGWDNLSGAQLGIAELVTLGLTNAEIGARLYLSRHTVDFHLRQIFSKLGIASRVELARMVGDRAAGATTRPRDSSAG